MAAKVIKGIIAKVTRPHPAEGDVPEQFNIKPDAKEAIATVPNTQKSLMP